MNSPTGRSHGHSATSALLQPLAQSVTATGKIEGLQGVNGQPEQRMEDGIQDVHGILHPSLHA